ncbi:SDR family NAD(P)-dependent oxidoreductase [Rhodovibrio salinarum]|uniref:Short-chain dehydrogenase n=1 Tax=Rhodovibrio salinarum TaxID=1087 RepID=A0A934QFL4_9PROT|nr:SDR family NAD(P)-dependent oxidoreductase [Rhodovibrio salinarum]MBK1695660.1 short-chain dehydrogenase [Rhodovibrio salinarum]
MSTQEETKIALVTGANKGIGYEIARQIGQTGAIVLVGARNPDRGQAAAHALAEEGIAASWLPLDVTEAQSIESAVTRIAEERGRLDILVNNAGIGAAGDGAPSKASLDAVRQVFETNFFGALAVTQAMLPLLHRSGAGRIVNLSSSLGSLKLNGDPSWEAYDVKLIGYNASKTALNMLTVQLAAELRDSPIIVQSICPGLTATDLTGHTGDRLPAEAATAPAHATLAETALQGRFADAQGDLPW